MLTTTAQWLVVPDFEAEASQTYDRHQRTAETPPLQSQPHGLGSLRCYNHLLQADAPNTVF